MRSALVISPFATVPLDAGHRRRTMQMTRLLSDAGFRVTFLLVAFENPWYWRHDEEFYEQLRAQWPEVILIYADRRVGLPPKQGALHGLDEWWDPVLEQTLVNLASRRFFEIAVVHNVWLSKAFDFLHPNTLKILETHDLFWKRSEVFARMGMKPEFFVTSEGSELFGVRRADIAVTIQEGEGAELLAKTGKSVFTVPFYDFALEAAARPQGPLSYLSPHKVTFGTLASDNPFNVVGLNALLEALERVVGETFAPVELLVAGNVGERIEKRAGVKCVGRVETEAEFYETVDFAIAPVFDGTGFKVKAADALALRVPTLLSSHAAQGCALDESLVCATPEIMARRMADIALRRPPLSDAQAHVRRARRDLRTQTESGAANLLSAIAEATRPLVVDLSDASPLSDRLVVLSYLCAVRAIAQRFQVTLLLDARLVRVVGKFMPLGASAMTRAQFERERDARPVAMIDVFGAKDRAALGLRADDTRLFDQRWSRAQAEAEAAFGVFGALPLFGANMSWEPSVLAMRRRDPGAAERFPAKGRKRLFVYTERAVAGEPSLDLGRGVAVFFIAPSDWLLFQDSVTSLLDGEVAEAVWTAQPGGAPHRAVIEACAMKGAGYYGWLDEAALGHGALPRGLAGELDKTVGQVVWQLKEHVSSS
jgi:hypothetical protein